MRKTASVGEFIAGSVWGRITEHVTTSGPRRIVVAYLGASAPTLLPLERGDLLIVAATIANARAGAINPEVIKHYIDAGVRVMAHQRLHAKVMRLGAVTIVGSANASATSASLEEAVVISRSLKLARDVDRFIDEIETDSIPIDDALLASLTHAWSKRTGFGPPGVDGPPDPDQWPLPESRLFVDQSWDSEYSAATEATAEQHRRRWKQRAGSKWEPDEWLSSLDYLRKFSEGDLLLLRHTEANGEVLVYPPAEVMGPAVAVPRTRNGILPLRYPAWIDPVPASEFDAALRRATGRTVDGTHQVRSGRVRAAVLATFRLGQDHE